eukprot:tig00000808_g4388.t1
MRPRGRIRAVQGGAGGILIHLQWHTRALSLPFAALLLLVVAAQSDAQQRSPCFSGIRVNITVPRYVCDGRTVTESEYLQRINATRASNSTALNGTQPPPTPAATPSSSPTLSPIPSPSPSASPTATPSPSAAANATVSNSTAANATALNSTSLNSTSLNSTALNSTSTVLTSTALNSTLANGTASANATLDRGPILINNCTNTTQPGFACICGVDRYGLLCEGYRRFACGMQFEQPACTEEAALSPRYRPELDGDPPCVFLPSRQASPLRLSARLKCDFLEPERATVPRYVSSALYASARRNLTYWAGTGAGFSISDRPVELAVRFKAFNWRFLTDTTGVRSVALTPEMALGLEAAEAELEIAALPDEFFAGGRLYIEAMMLPPGGARGFEPASSGLERRFVDFADYALPAPAGSSRVGLIVGAVLGSLAAAALLVGGGLWWYRSRLKKNE